MASSTSSDWRERLASNQLWLRAWLRGLGLKDPDAALWPASPPGVALAVESVVACRPIYDDEVALVEQWFVDARQAMYRVLRAERVPAEHQDDLAQEAITRVMEVFKRREFPTRPETEADLRRWALGVLRHVLHEHRRKATREAPTDDLAEALPTRGDLTAAATLAQVTPALFDALETLPDAQRGAWIAVDLEDADIGRLADVTQTPYETVCSQLKLARRKLAAVLKPHR